jgi:hypothetical protein
MSAAPQRKIFGQQAAAPVSPFGGTLGVIAIAFGIGVLGAYVLDLHAHTCDACGRKWRHLGAFNGGDPTAHTCTCGMVQWWKDGAPHVFRSALRPMPPGTRAIAPHVLSAGRFGGGAG